ncbi:MAG: PIN domain-containing protein [Candidatus Micrarchaeota archaeon]
MKTILLDTNFLLIPHQFKIDIIARLEHILEEPHEIIISSAIMNELNELATRSGKDAIAARVALRGVKKKNIKIIETNETNVDRWIVDYCTAHPNTIVCTNDIKLKKMLKKMCVRIIAMRTKTNIFWV